MRTDYAGQWDFTRLEPGGRAIELARPADPDRLLDDPGVLEWNRRDDYMPYWAYLWPGTFLLADKVAAAGDWGGAEALEIGCGLGLAGLTAMACGARVTFTDYDEAPFPFIRASVERMGLDPSRCECRTMDWREPPDETFPTILAADVLYEHRLVPLVVGVIRKMLAADGVAWISGPYRVATLDLEPLLDAARLRHEATPAASIDDRGRPVRGTIHRVWKA
ncbi:MAG: methyltransferase [Isosphaeraceae bacterium]